MQRSHDLDQKQYIEQPVLPSIFQNHPPRSLFSLISEIDDLIGEDLTTDDTTFSIIVIKHILHKVRTQKRNDYLQQPFSPPKEHRKYKTDEENPKTPSIPTKTSNPHPEQTITLRFQTEIQNRDKSITHPRLPKASRFSKKTKP